MLLLSVFEIMFWYRLPLLIINLILIHNIVCSCVQNEEDKEKLVCTIINDDNLSTVNNFADKLNYKKLEVTADSETYLRKLPPKAINFPTITELKLVGISSLKEIDSNAFNNLEYLKEFQIDRSAVKTIRKNLFKNLLELEKIKISYTQVKEIEFGAFDSLTNLIVLDLSRNKIEILETGLFDKLSNLEQLNLAYNKIYGLGENLFLKLSKLKWFYFDENQIVSIPKKLFKTVHRNSGRIYYESKIERLLLSGNSLHRFSRLDYVDLNLKLLSLVHNRLGHNIDDDAFESMPNLESLNLANNQITNLSAINWSFLTRLKELNLGSNELVTFNGSAFKALVELRDLNFQANNFVLLESQMFEFIPKLEYLSFHSNPIQKLDGSVFSGLKHLKELELVFTKIVHIDSDTFKHVPLVKLSISFGAPKLNFTTFLSSLVSLNLGFCKITTLNPTEFAQLNNLHYLLLEGNLIEEIPDDFFVPMKQLEEIQLSKNRIQKLQKNVFAPLQSLTKLELHLNQIKQIDADAFVGLNQLTFLNLRGNQLRTVHSNWFNLTNLKLVSIAANQISYLPKDLLHGSQCNVEDLFVFDNRLTFIDDEVFDNTTLKQLSFAQNPWLCSCLDRIDQSLFRNNITSLWDRGDGKKPSCVVFKNNMCIKDLSFNNEIFEQYKAAIKNYLPGYCLDNSGVYC